MKNSFDDNLYRIEQGKNNKLKSCFFHEFNNEEIEEIERNDLEKVEIPEIQTDIYVDSKNLANLLRKYKLFDTSGIRKNGLKKTKLYFFSQNYTLQQITKKMGWPLNENSQMNIIANPDQEIYVLLAKNKGHLNVAQSMLCAIYSYKLRENGYYPMHSALVSFEPSIYSYKEMMRTPLTSIESFESIKCNFSVAIAGAPSAGKSYLGMHCANEANGKIAADDWILIDCKSKCFFAKTICNYGYVHLENTALLQKKNWEMISLQKAIVPMNHKPRSNNLICGLLLLTYNREEKKEKLQNFDYFEKFIHTTNPHRIIFENISKENDINREREYLKSIHSFFQNRVSVLINQNETLNYSISNIQTFVQLMLKKKTFTSASKK